MDTLLEKYSDDIKGRVIGTHVVLDIIKDKVHYWSPQLNFRVERDNEKDNHSIVSGLIGPRPEVWTMFMFVYFAIGISGFFIGSYGVVKMLLGEYSNYILAFPMTIILMLTAYGTGKYGERLAEDQIETLKQFVRDAISFEKKDLEI